MKSLYPRISKNTYSYLTIIVLTLLLNSCTDLPRTIYYESFDGPNLPELFFVEGSDKVEIRDGRLWMDASPEVDGESGVGTIWLNQEFSGDLKVEFDVNIIESKGDKNNINFFFLYSDTTGKPLYDSRDRRVEGRYSTYHKMNGYIFTYLAGGTPDTARFRFRNCPGFNLLQENFAYHCRKNRVYHIEITKISNRLTFAVDGEIYIDYRETSNNPIHSQGIMGFRTYRTELWWDNFKITKL
ncbi:MAG: YesU family protein [Melioribacteraceae bacterium]|nr:YesU family protein [Melioribacteraceae bacterium]